MTDLNKLKIALVHDHLAQDGGAERVLRVMQEIFPSAVTFTLFYNPAKADPFFKTKNIQTSWMQKLPFIKTKYQWYLHFMPLAIESFNFDGFDLVISNTSALAKGIITGPDTFHLCYCHTPTRYLWSDRLSYLRELQYPAWLKKMILPFLHRLRLWDYAAAQRPDAYLANSLNIQKRIAKYYHRQSKVLYPPVELSKFKISDQEKKYYLIGGRLVPYKKYDLAIKAFSRLGMPLKLFGTGPELNRLKKIAKKNIDFLGKVNSDQLADLYANCLAFLHPQQEDFGITPLEAMASGRPVIAYGSGGALETVADEVTGKLLDEQSWEAIADAVINFQPEKYDPLKIREHAQKFSVQNFKINFLQAVSEEYEKWQI